MKAIREYKNYTIKTLLFLKAYVIYTQSEEIKASTKLRELICTFKVMIVFLQSRVPPIPTVACALLRIEKYMIANHAPIGPRKRLKCVLGGKVATRAT